MASEEQELWCAKKELESTAGQSQKGPISEEAAEKGRNEINQIATLLENAIWHATGKFPLSAQMRRSYRQEAEWLAWNPASKSL